MDVTTLIRFFTQLSLVVAGAASLWGYVFSRKALKTKKNSKELWNLSTALMLLFSIAFVFFVFGWWFLAFTSYPIVAHGHEGVVHATQDAIWAGFQANFPIVVLATITGVAGIFIFRRPGDLFKKISYKFFGLQFVLLSIILSFSWYTDTISRFQFSYMLHNWHSIITLGTVIVVDFLFLYTSGKKRDKLKRVLYPAYPVLSAFIWIGLGMDFLSSGLFQGFNPSLATPQFVFNQIVIAIIIMNGALLSVYLNKEFIKLIKKTTVSKPSEALEEIARISGSVSIISWLTITFLDFADIPLDLNIFFSVYLGLIAVAYLSKPIAEKQLEAYI